MYVCVLVTPQEASGNRYESIEEILKLRELNSLIEPKALHMLIKHLLTEL